MRMAMKSGQILIKEADSTQFSVIKSWGKMRWNRADQTLRGNVDQELLNKLAELVRLPEEIEAERKRMNAVSEAVDRERLNENPAPLIKYPVKLPLFKHQMRGANMCMLTFGLVDPPKGRCKVCGAIMDTDPDKEEICDCCRDERNNKD